MHCFREGGRPRYAVKMLQEDIARNPAMLTRASIDMAVESQILSSVRHPNIIKMHACGASPYKADYFIGTLRRGYERLIPCSKQLFTHCMIHPFVITLYVPSYSH